MRLDVFVAQKYPEYSRAALAKLFKNKGLTVNGKTVKHGYKLHTGDSVQIDPSPLNQKVEISKLPILYEDNEVIVMNKPSGMLTHSKGSFNSEPTVASFLATKLMDTDLHGNRAGIVHRLDRATSGVIIGAKDRETQKWLQKQFSKRNVKKIYHAVVEGRLGDDPLVSSEHPLIDVAVKELFQ